MLPNKILFGGRAVPGTEFPGDSFGGPDNIHEESCAAHA